MKQNKKANNSKNVDGIVKSITDQETTETSNQTNVTESQVETKEVATVKEPKAQPVKKASKPKKDRKVGFFGSTLSELKKVNWPGFKYVTGWSMTIILFTLVAGSVIGFTDYYFESGIIFIDCTSPSGGKSKPVNDCLRDLSTNLTFQKYFNRTSAPTNNTTAPTNTDEGAPLINSSTNVTQPTITSSPDIKVNEEGAGTPSSTEPTEGTTTPNQSQPNN